MGASGAVLFDRDPRYFSPVLNYLRTSVLILPEDVSLEGLLLEAQFFQIARLQEDILSELEAREARANNIHKKRYVVLTVKGDGIKLIEGPVDDVMRNLNGARPAPADGRERGSSCLVHQRRLYRPGQPRRSPC